MFSKTYIFIFGEKKPFNIVSKILSCEGGEFFSISKITNKREGRDVVLRINFRIWCVCG